MSREVFIAGGSGFVGGNLTKFLSNEGYQVYALVRPNSNLWRLENVKAEVVTGDVTNLDSLSALISKIKPQFIINCATNGVYRNQQDNQEIYQVNVVGTHNLLEASLSLPDLKMFIQTGSVYEYTDLPGQREENITGTPRNMYDTVKIMTTTMAQGYSQHYQLPLVILRLFTVFGPYEDKRRLVPQVMQALAENRSPNIAPQAIRDFIYVDDVMAAYGKALELHKPQGQVINVASGQPTHVGDFVQEILEYLNTDIKPNISSTFAPTNDSQCWADIQRAKKILNWEPQYNTDTAIKLTVDWHQQHE